MVKKILKVSAPEKCIGCELCVFAVQRMLNRVGVEGTPIRILSSGSKFSIHLDPSVNELDVKKVSEICPKGCFSVEDATVDNGPEFEFKDDPAAQQT